MKNNIKNIQKKSLVYALIFTLIIGIGMYISFHIRNIPYSDPKLVETLWLVEIILSLVAIYFAKKHFSAKELGFRKINWRQYYWFILPTILIALIWFNLLSKMDFSTISMAQKNLFFLVGFTTLLVGFSEELMYRGIVFSAYLRENKLKAVWVSAIAFSLLHSVNYFAGQTVGLVVGQLFSTLIFGLFFALVKLRIKSIIPLMIFHFLWDFALIGANVLNIQPNLYSVLYIIVQVVSILILLFLLKKEPKSSKTILKNI